MGPENPQDGSADKTLTRRRIIHLPSVDPGCDVALRVLHLGKYEDSPHLLGNMSNWDDLKQKLQPVADFVVKDAVGQYFVDGVRRRFDSVKISDPKLKREDPFVTGIIRRNVSGSEEIVKMLLAVGMDPDLPDFRKWRPSHWCGFMARVDVAGLIFLCRPDMVATCDVRDWTPFQVASSYKDEKEDPRRAVFRADVRDFIRNGGFQRRFPTLPELAVRRLWFAVKNLLRRGVVADSEFEEKVGEKTAAEWAEADKELGIAKEIRYYATALSVRFEQTAKQMTAMAEKLCNTEDRESSNSSELKKMKLELVENKAKIEELSEVVAVFRSKLEQAGIGCDMETAIPPRHDSVRGGSSVDEGGDADSLSASSSSKSKGAIN